MSPSSSKYPIAYLEVRVFSHATEDLQKVQAAVKNILPETLAEQAVFNKTNCVGHHGNPIVLVETKLEDKQVLPQVLEKIGSSLSSLDKEQLGNEIKDHIEKHNLYIRIDKQNAYLGNIKLGFEDAMRLKIHFKNKKPTEIEEICRQSGLIP